MTGSFIERLLSWKLMREFRCVCTINSGISFVCPAGQMVLNKNGICGWQIKKQARRQLINGAWRTCNMAVKT